MAHNQSYVTKSAEHLVVN